MARGLRNFNPGNIEYGDFARRLGATGSDGRFAIFPDMASGINAMRSLLRSYQNRGLTTVASMINRWAPPSDNNPTSAYAQRVAQAMGVGVNDPIQPNDNMIAAMIAVENDIPFQEAYGIVGGRGVASTGQPPGFNADGPTARPAPMPIPTNMRERMANFIRQAPMATMMRENQEQRAAGGSPILERMREIGQGRQEGRRPVLEAMQQRRQARGLQTPILDRILSRMAPQQAPQEIPAAFQQTPMPISTPSTGPQEIFTSPQQEAATAQPGMPPSPVMTASQPPFDVNAFLQQQNPMASGIPPAALSALMGGQPQAQQPPGFFLPNDPRRALMF